MSSQTIAVIDYGMGNLHSVSSALQHVAPNDQVIVTADKTIIANADRVVFPGVGAIRDCMAEIRRLGFDQAVTSEIQSGKPLLAICVGMQALMTRSEENGGVNCLDHFSGEVKFFSSSDQFKSTRDEGSHSGERLKVPHMGWNQVVQKMDHPLWHDIADQSRFYFVHSYYVDIQDQTIQAGRTHYGIDFTAAIAQKNVFAAQFHPEKSHHSGLQLLKNFVSWNGQS